MTRPTYGRFTLDYIERTGPVDRVGLVTTDGTDLTANDTNETDVREAAEALSGKSPPTTSRSTAAPPRSCTTHTLTC